MNRDAVIIDVEFRMESDYEPYGHFINLRFVDESPTLIKLSSFIKQLSAFDDVKLIDYNYNIEPITENTDITDFEIVKYISKSAFSSLLVLGGKVWSLSLSIYIYVLIFG